MIVFLSVKCNSYLAQTGTDTHWNTYYQLPRCKRSQPFSAKLSLLKNTMKCTPAQIHAFYFQDEKQKHLEVEILYSFTSFHHHSHSISPR